MPSDWCLLVWSKQVIADITKGMGEGMADFIEKEVLTIADYDLYCHYVAGLVGIGLSQVLPCPRHCLKKLSKRQPHAP